MKHLYTAVATARGGREGEVVSDDGVGIDPERIGGIFELFAQAENAIGRAQGGMGIGVSNWVLARAVSGTCSSSFRILMKLRAR